MKGTLMNRIRTNLLAAAVLAVGSLLASPSAAVQISELLYDAVGSDNGTLFVELWGVPGTSLEGWQIEGVNGADGAIGPIVALSGEIPADGFFVVADSDAGTTLVANADLLANFDFQNGPDSIVLRNALGELLDSLGYGVFGAAEVFAGEGSPAPDGAPGQSLARIYANRDSDDNAADFALFDSPTPGSGAIALPEPVAVAPVLLFACGLGLARARHARPPSAVG
jgi:hypothetical protein